MTKIGIQGVDNTLATPVRAAVMLAVLLALALARGSLADVARDPPGSGPP
jgi:uncharacterized membrane protein